MNVSPSGPARGHRVSLGSTRTPLTTSQHLPSVSHRVAGRPEGRAVVLTLGVPRTRFRPGQPGQAPVFAFTQIQRRQRNLRPALSLALSDTCSHEVHATNLGTSASTNEVFRRCGREFTRAVD